MGTDDAAPSGDVEAALQVRAHASGGGLTKISVAARVLLLQGMLRRFRMATSRPTVSVVIPCHNASSFVRRALRSVAAQTLPASSVICVDDGSTDDTLDVLQAFAAEATIPITVISQENAGGAAARNAGLEMVDSDYVQFLDADDELLPDKLATQVAELDHSRADLLAGAFLS